MRPITARRRVKDAGARRMSREGKAFGSLVRRVPVMAAAGT
jgi:hypothetical protein